MNKRLFALLLAGLLALSLAACGRKAPSEDAGGSIPEETNPEPSAYPMTLTDMAGRQVTLEAEPQRIVSGYYISSSACIALGLADRLAGIEDKAGQRPIYALAAPQLMDLPNVGSAKAFDLEACAAAEPDLVILPLKQQDTAEALEALGIPTLLVLPESHHQILEMFSLIGQATGTSGQAELLSSWYTEKLEETARLTADQADRPVTYICGTGSYLTTAPGGMYQADLINAAGGVSAGDSLEGSSWVEISYEQLLAMNPDVIIIPTNSTADGAPDFGAADILGDPQLSAVTAVKNGAIYQMPTGFEAWDSPAPSGILGTLWMLSTLHPELYSQADFAADATAFYESFYGFTPDISALTAQAA